MKIRNGFVSNSSSCGFIIASKFLTEEQKEALLSCDDGEKERLWTLIDEKFGTKYQDEPPLPIYKKNEVYHQILEKMKNQDWDNWTINESDDVISGGTIMDNGYLLDFMKEIDIDLTCIEWDGDNGTYKATNPEAISFFIEKHKKEFSKLTEEDKEFFKDMRNEKALSELSIYEKENEDGI